METRANHVWVGAVTLVLLAALALFFVWLAGINKGEQNEYDIFFKQSVGERTTSSVVQTISLVIILDAVAAIWFMQMGW